MRRRLACAAAAALLGAPAVQAATVLFARVELSRNHVLVDFSSDARPYVARESVGGEHMNRTQFVAYHRDARRRQR